VIMALLLGLLAIFLLVSTSFHHKFSSSRSLHQLQASIRLLIQGTKNAYTTIQTGDVVSFKTSKPQDGKSIRLGVLSADGKILPLAAVETGSAEFVVDSSEEPLSAARLKDADKLLRMYSADRRGETYTIDEYLDAELLYMPVVQSVIEKSYPMTGNENVDIAVTEAELAVAELKAKLLRLRSQQNTNNLSSVQPLLAVQSENAPKPIGPYSQGIRQGNILYVSGCIGIDPATHQLVSGGIEVETKQALSNLAAVLESGNSSSKQITKVTIYCMDLQNDYSIINRLYGEFLESSPLKPARTTIQVAGLPLKARIEIDAIAQCRP